MSDDADRAVDGEQPAPQPRAEALFQLDLGDNGGPLAPTSHGELNEWIRAEVNFWNWCIQRSYGNHEQGFPDAYSSLSEAQGRGEDAERHLSSNAEHARQQLQTCRNHIEAAFLNKRLPHSSTPLARRIDAYRRQHGDRAESFYLGVFVPPAQGHNFWPNELDAWRALVDGLVDRFDLGANLGQARVSSSEEAFEQLWQKAQHLVDSRSLEYDALHREYGLLVDAARTSATQQIDEFAAAQATRDKQFTKQFAEHQSETASSKTKAYLRRFRVPDSSGEEWMSRAAISPACALMRTDCLGPAIRPVPAAGDASPRRRRSVWKNRP